MSSDLCGGKLRFLGIEPPDLFLCRKIGDE
jgi:hypothetical protein